MSATMYQPIKSYAIQSEPHLIDWNGKYAFNAKGKYPRIQRWCFWLLDKLGAQWQDTTLTYKRVEIDTHDVLQLVQRQVADLSRVVGTQKRFRVVVGYEQMLEITRKQYELGPTQFNFRVEGMYGHMNAGKAVQTVLGIPIIVVPWIDGCFVMYDEDFK